MLKLDTLRKIRGLTWSEHCYNCDLIRSVNLTNLIKSKCKNKVRFVFPEYVRYGPSTVYIAHGFYPSCLCKDETCFASEISFPLDRSSYLITRKVYPYITVGVGSVSIALNFVVIVNIFRCKSLRSSSMFILIASIAICDLTLGIEEILSSKFNMFQELANFETFSQHYVWVENRVCPYMGITVSYCFIMGALSTFVLTLEKYFAIVFCMNPNIRVSKSNTVAFLLTSWVVVLSIIFFFSLVWKKIVFEPHVLCAYSVAFSLPSLIVISLVLFEHLLTLPLYLHIYIVVRKSANTHGIKRKIAFVRKVGAVVLTNFILYMFPLGLSVAMLVKNEDLMESIGAYNSFLSYKVLSTVSYTLPGFCMLLNGCLNPILLAYSHNRFSAELKSGVLKTVNYICDKSTALRNAIWQLICTKRPKTSPQIELTKWNVRN